MLLVDDREARMLSAGVGEKDLTGQLSNLSEGLKTLLATAETR